VTSDRIRTKRPEFPCPNRTPASAGRWRRRAVHTAGACQELRAGSSDRSRARPCAFARTAWLGTPVTSGVHASGSVLNTSDISAVSAHAFASTDIAMPDKLQPCIRFAKPCHLSNRSANEAEDCCCCVCVGRHGMIWFLFSSAITRYRKKT
jgi:hypothetical protein